MIHIFQIFHPHTTVMHHSRDIQVLFMGYSYPLLGLKDDQRTTKGSPVKSRRQVDTEFIWGLVDNNQLVVTKVVIDMSRETDGVTITDSGHIDTSTLKLVDECLVMIGTHTCPAGITNLTIEYYY